LDLARRAMDATGKIARGIKETPGLRILGKPVMSCLAIGADNVAAPRPHCRGVDLYVLVDRMQARGWRMDRQQNPPSLHLTVSPAHDTIADTFVDDLRACTRE